MDGDANDSASTSQRRFSPYGSQRRPRNGRPGGSLPAMDQPSNGIMSRLGIPFASDPKRDGGDWYRVSIPFGKKLDKDFVEKSIASIASVPFVPVNYHTENQEAVFYVYGSVEARAIQNTTKRITTPTGFKMVVNARRSSPPATPLNEVTVTKLKECMSKRYDATAFSLNLTDLCNDDDLKKENIFLSMRRAPVIFKILQIIGEHIPELKVLDLSKNCLEELDSFSRIEEKAPNVQQLNLAHNQIKYERKLYVFGKLNLIELCLEGNPVVGGFSDRQKYISAIRKIFPKVLKLDGNELPPPITFDVEVPTDLPAPKGNFFLGDKKVEEIICNFVTQYFALYDSANRQPLIDAYHEQAVFSLSSYSLGQWSGSGKQPSLADYNVKCRNLVRIKDSSQRQHRLKMGRVAIVGALSELPVTQHDLQSFVVDASFALGSMLTFTICGVFKEISNKSERDVIRQFSRTFVVFVSGERFAITNEMLCLSNVPTDAAKKYFQQSVTAPLVTPQPSSVAVAAIPSVEMQQNMIVSFSSQSGMNERFSRLCLEQNGWDYDRSAAVFLDMKAKNSIPPEAFTN